MTEKMGRKALFMGVPEKEPPEDDSFARARMGEIHALMEKALDGDFSGRLSTRGPGREWERLAESVNSFFSRIEQFASKATLYKKIFDQQTAPFILKDPGGETILYNPSYEELEESSATPLEKEGIGSESMTSFVASDGNPHTREIKLLQKDGTEMIIEERSTPLRDEKGVFAVLFTLHDISAYRKGGEETPLPPVEGEIRSGISPRSFLEQIPVPGLIIDSAQKILAFNEAFLSMSGIAAEALAGTDYRSFDILESRGEDVAYIPGQKAAGSAELTMNFPSGARIVRQYGNLFEGEDGGTGLVLLFVDLTAEIEERAILESQVQELQYSLRLLEEESATGTVPEPAALPEQEPDLRRESPGEPGDQETQPVGEKLADTSPEAETGEITEAETERVARPGPAAVQEIFPGPEPRTVPGMDDRTIPGIPAVPGAKDVKGPSLKPGKADEATGAIHEVVEFSLGKENYALDIEYAREIVEMMPITPVPRAPQYLKGIINLRGEITSILDINQMLGVSASTDIGGKKIIILSSEACGGEKIGIIVDDVHSVIQIHEDDAEHLGDSIQELSGYIKGILQVSGRGLTEKKDEKTLLIWIDIYRLLCDLLGE
jgi:purine-binding chemotaxis protein CheW